MPSSFVLKKKDMIQNVTTGFLPSKVLIPLCQEKNVLCKSVVQTGMHVEEGQIIAEANLSSNFDATKIHSPIPGIVQGIKKCSYPNGKSGEAIEIALSGNFSHIGKKPHEFEWKTWGRSSILNRISAQGVINTFSLREPFSLAASVRAIEQSKEKRIFIRLYDEDLSCQTDSVLARSNFEKILDACEILSEILEPREIVFAYAKSNIELAGQLAKIKDSTEDPSSKETRNLRHIQLLPVNERKFPCGTKFDIAARYKKAMRIELDEKFMCDNSLFVDADTLVGLYDAVVLNIPVMRVNVHVSGDCLKSSAVLKVCVGTSFKNLAQELGLEEKNIGKIIVNGYMNGFSVPSINTPVTKYVKSIAFISKHDIADYSAAYCIGCGKCRVACPTNICPDVLFSHLVNSVKIPNDFIRTALFCTDCGLCNSVCPVKLPLFQSVKILKERQDAKQ